MGVDLTERPSRDMARAAATMGSNYKTGGAQRLELTVPAEMAGLRLDQALARMLPQHSRSRISGWMRAGEVQVSGAVAMPKQKVWGGEQVSLAAEPPAEELAHRPEPLALTIVHEDETLIVIDKPAGLVVHPGSGNWSGTLLNALLHHHPELSRVPRAGIVHRLDKDTSGLLVVAKTLPAHTDLVRQLARRSVARIYLAIAAGDIGEPGAIDAPIGRHRVHRTRMAVVAGGRSARTRYSPLERLGPATLIECALETGRTHQIRVHLASIGHPLLGDPVYGRRTKSKAERIGAVERQALHAARLELDHPASGKRMRFRSAFPDDLQAALERLRAAYAK